VLTTFTSYGEVAAHRQAALIRGLTASPSGGSTAETLEARMARLEAAVATGTLGMTR
jgi:hypothetical protein